MKELTLELDDKYLRETIRLSEQCPPSQTAFSVGAIITDEKGNVISTGFSRELGMDSHAEGVAIEKALAEGKNLEGFTLYSSMEPCSVRKSGKIPCCTRIIDQKLKRVVFGIREPENFVICEGLKILREKGILVEHLSGFEEEIRKRI